MSLNTTPQGERMHIALFGRRNAGKSSIINAITNQNLAIVSEIKGTTTDPVSKAMELLPLGPVVLIDTPGLDDTGELGAQRIAKTQQVLNKADIALLVLDSVSGFSSFEADLLAAIQAKKIPCLLVVNKCDLADVDTKQLERTTGIKALKVSATTADGMEALKEAISKLIPEDDASLLVGDLLQPDDLAVLVVPIDASAPKGRLILPQQQVIRDILEAQATAIVTRETELSQTLTSLARKPKMVITDSQAFAQVAAITPEDIPLTSFSILMARYKGDLVTLVSGIQAIARLKNGDRILLAEGCTHHRQCEDIGTVKIPRWLRQHTGKQFHFEINSGLSFPANLEDYALVIHCGGCTLNRREMKYRIQYTREHGVPIVNYGILIAYLQGVLQRSLALFPQAASQLKNE